MRWSGVPLGLPSKPTLRRGATGSGLKRPTDREAPPFWAPDEVSHRHPTSGARDGTRTDTVRAVGRPCYEVRMFRAAHITVGAHGSSRLVHDDRDRFDLIARIEPALGTSLLAYCAMPTH